LGSCWAHHRAVRLQQGKSQVQKKCQTINIEGSYFDCFAPLSKNAEQIRRGIKEKVYEEQAQRIVLNFSRSDASVSDVQAILKRKPLSGLKEVIGIMKDGTVVTLFP
jgi:hypothetical protein